MKKSTTENKLIKMFVLSVIILLILFFVNKIQNSNNKLNISGFVLSENIDEFNNSDFINDKFKKWKDWKLWRGIMESNYLIDNKQEIGKDEIINLKGIYTYKADPFVSRSEDLEKNYKLLAMSKSVEVGIDNDDLISIISFNIQLNDIYYSKIKQDLNEKNMELLNVDVEKYDSKYENEGFRYTFKYKYKEKTEANKNVVVALFFTSKLKPDQINGKELNTDNVKNLSISFYDRSLTGKTIKNKDRLF